MLEKIIEEEQIDLMVYHAYLGNMLFWDLMMLKGHRIPFVVCTHSVFSRFAMEGYYRTFVKMPFLYRFCDCLLTLSRTDVEFYRGLGIRVTYMPNPVDLSVGREKMASLDSFSMLWMGRISEEKVDDWSDGVTEQIRENMGDVHYDLEDKVDYDSDYEVKSGKIELYVLGG